MAKKDKKAVKKEKDSSSSDLIQKFKQNPALFIGTVIILVLVVGAFVIGPLLGAGAGSSGDLTFGYYDKAPISWVPGNMFARTQEQAVQYFQAMGYDLSNMWTAADIWRMAYENAAAHTAILQIMKRSNYEVPEHIVDREVARQPVFQENGRFSAALYSQMSESRRLALWRQVQEELTRGVFINDYYYGMMTPDTEAQFIGKMASNMKSFEMAIFNINDYPEEEYRLYAMQNARLFSSIHLSRIVINSSEREAQRVLDLVLNGTITFEDAARSYSQDGFADRGGDMGSRFYHDIETEFLSADDLNGVLQMARGQISGVIRITGNSWAFYRVEEELKPADFDDTAVMDRVRLYLSVYDRGRMEDFAIARARDFISDVRSFGFDYAVYQHNPGTRSFGPLPLNFGGVDLFITLESFFADEENYYDFQYLSSNENFWRVAFSTPLNSPSEPVVEGNMVLVLYSVEFDDEEYSMMDTASMYSSYWLPYISEQSMQYYFLNNPRMDDRFWEVYFDVFFSF